MVCFRTSKSIVLVAILALFIEYSNQYELKNVIKEEEESIKLTPGKNKNLINKLRPKEMNTNKEFVFGEDDEDNSDEDKKLDTETPTSDLNMMNNKPFETEMLNEESSEESREANLLKRSQRVDLKHLDKKQPTLLKVDKLDDLQQKLLELSEKHNFDYDILLDDEFSELNKNKILKTNNYKKANSFESFEDDEDDTFEDDETVTIDDLLSKLTSKIKSKQLKSKYSNPTLQIKEQIYMEGVFNKNKAKEQNSFFNPENELELEREFGTSEVNDVLKEDLNAKNNQTGTQNINSNPSYKMRNENTHESVDSKFELIKRQNDYLFLFVVAGCTLAGVLALLAASVCWYTVAKTRRASKGANYEFENSKNSLFGTPHHTNSSSMSGSIKSKGSNSSGDKKLALSAQMYHFQHQKEQIIAMEKANSESKPDDSDNSDDETPEGDYTVYECPGLAPTGEMEVKNPLFKEDYTGSSNSLSSKQAPPPSYSTVALNTNEINDTVPSETKTAETTEKTEKTKL